MSCSKQNEWLDEKSNKAYVVPETLTDFQAIMDNTTVFNYNSYNTAGLVGADDFYINDIDLAGRTEVQRNLYVWNKQIWINENTPDWNGPFTVIEQANIILEGLQKIKSLDIFFNNIKGQALFHRAWAYYALVQLFCKPYSAVDADHDLGLPIRLNSDVNVLYPRASLKETYDLIIADALEASKLLPGNQPHIQRPINAAAHALLAKTYLNMGRYVDAGNFANKVLSLRSTLLDFNNVNLVSLNRTYRFPIDGINNPEILFYTYGAAYPIWPHTSNVSFVDTDLYKSYKDFDLRKTLFYIPVADGIRYRGSFSGNYRNFTGLAINETYLIQAECYARAGNKTSAMETLNKLLLKRHVADKFTELVASNAADALSIILKERRKELAFVSNIRWEDLKRLNKDPDFAKTLTRTVNGITYTLPPNDKRYILPIPDYEINVSSLRQNER